MGIEEVGQLDKELAPILRGLLAPVALEGLASGSNGDVDIFLSGFVDRANDVLGRRVDDFECLAFDTSNEVVVDEAIKSA